MVELHGKGWRVLGYFLWMLGAGVWLDGEGTWWGRILLALGVALFVIGVLQSRQRQPTGGAA